PRQGVLAMELDPNKVQSERDKMHGDVELQATWDAGVDVDLGLVDARGRRYSWLGAGEARGLGHGFASQRGETLAFATLPVGRYVLEVTRADGRERAAVQGVVRVELPGSRFSIPFGLEGVRKDLATVEIKLESELVPVPMPPG